MTIPVPAYRAPARILHWVMALLVIPMIIAGIWMTQQGIPRSLQNTLFIFHKNTGVLLLVMIFVRIAYRLRNAPPPEPDHLPDWQKKIASLTHGLLYVLLVVMPLSGYIRVKAGGFPIETIDSWGIPALVPRSEALADIAKSIHYVGSWIIVVLALMHVGAALQHGLLKRDGVFSRMWPSASKSS